MQSTENATEVRFVIPRWMLNALVVSAEGRGLTVTDRLVQILSRHLQGELAE